MRKQPLALAVAVAAALHAQTTFAANDEPPEREANVDESGVVLVAVGAALVPLAVWFVVDSSQSTARLTRQLLAPPSEFFQPDVAGVLIDVSIEALAAVGCGVTGGVMLAVGAGRLADRDAALLILPTEPVTPPPSAPVPSSPSPTSAPPAPSAPPLPEAAPSPGGTQ